MPDVYVVDTGECEVYVFADDEFEACAKVCEKLGLEKVNYAEFYSTDPNDADHDLLD